ncbi:MAG: methyl-accepting chemotaxis protein [Acidobacteria bacterium]|nr:methyl-accepting chemotaxis protein [Acidobacteriota bacterium]MBI3423139.1 methyl-accepting chemotaxis protein [Acidobacteriota bacterium]
MLKNLQLLQRLKIWQKLILIALFMGLPIPVITWLYVTEKGNTIGFAQKELYGTELLLPLQKLAKEIANHRGLASALLRGETSLQSQLSEAARGVEQQLAAAEEQDRREIGQTGNTYGGLLQTSGKLRALRQKWNLLKSKTAQTEARANFDEHTQLIAEVNDLIIYAGDTSNLILDPDLDTYYLMDAVIIQIPRLAEEANRLRGLGAGLAVAKKATPEEFAQLTTFFSQVQVTLQNLERSFGKAYAANPSLKDRHDGQLEILAKEVNGFIVWADRQLTRSSDSSMLATQFLAAGAPSIERLMQLHQLALDDLKTLLQARVDKVKRERNSVLVLTVLGLLLTVLAVAVITRGVNQQTQALTQLIAHIDNGNFEERAPVLSSDELGRTAQAFNNMLDNTRGLMQSRTERDEIQRSIIKLLDEVSGVAEGDLTREAEVTEGMTGAIADAFNYMMDSLRQLIGKVQNVSQQVNSTAAETQTSAERLAQGSQEQAAQITNTTMALAEMTRAIQQVAESAELSAAVADQSLSTTHKGSEIVQHNMHGMLRVLEQVQETARQMQQLSERSQEIEEIVHLIDEIADRTGVLALNASIQAATAGEAGAGFAVVAREVEQLAGRSADATKRISTLIRTIQGGTRDALSAMEETSREVLAGSKLANQAGQSLTEIEGVTNRLAELVRAIADDCKLQARSSTQLSQTMAQIAKITNQTTNGVIQSAVTVKSLAELADELRASVVSFKLPGNAPGKVAGPHFQAGKAAYGTAHLN